MTHLSGILLLAVLRANPAPAPVVPFLEENICPFEYGCAFRAWTTCQKIVIYPKVGASKAIGHLAKGVSFRALRGHMVITRIGVARVMQPVESLPQVKSGSAVKILSYTGEGSYNVWVNGMHYNIQSFWSPDDPDARGVLEIMPLMTWWVEIQRESGKSAWLAFSNLDLNGQESYLSGMQDISTSPEEPCYAQ